MRELIRAQEKTVISQAEQLLEKIQKEIAEQKKIDAELDKLSHTEDHIHFLEVRPDVENLCYMQNRNKTSIQGYLRCFSGSIQIFSPVA